VTYEVAAVRRVLPRPEVDPRLLTRAAGPGRVRGLALDAWGRALASPRAAGGILRRALREARALHSRERRFVSDVVFDLIRAGGALRPWLSPPGSGARPELASWLAWLVHLGLDVEVATEAARAEGLDVDLSAAVDLPATFAQVLAALPEDRAAAALAGVPDVVGGDLRRSLGRGLVDFLAASNDRAPVVLRAHDLDRDELVARLRATGIEAVPGRWAASAVVVPTGTQVPPTLLRHAEVQDEASQLVATLVDARPGERILDLCAGAGGKTLALGAALRGKGELWATDVRGHALAELKRRAKEGGVRVRTALLVDGVPSCDLGGAFDAVLVDAPCAGTGVWRRHPELRWRTDDLPVTTRTQDEVLEQAADRVKPGGRLIYATCSVLRAEGEERIEAFVRRRPAFRVVDAGTAARGLDDALVTDGFLRTWPHRHGTDGFFGAVLRRA
jgi:16S rRNA (cytosine967-C5)-methyltransferase